MIPDYRVYSLSIKQRLIFYTLAAIALIGLAHLFYDHMVVSLLFCCLVYPASTYYSRYLAEKRRRELTYQFRDLLYVLSSSISAGRQMRESIKEVRTSMELIYGKEACISRELEHMVTRMEESKETEESVLQDFALRSAIPDIINFSDTYTVCKRTGGNMEKAIRKAVAILIDRIELDREIRTLTAQKRMEFIILIAMPPVMILFLRVTSEQYLAVMYETSAGRVLMTMAFLAIGVAAAIAFRMTRIRL